MQTQSHNPKELKDLILRRLGAPVVHVEVTEQQIYESIQRALELYGEYHYDGVNKAYHVIRVESDDEYKHGVFDLSADNVFAITQIVQMKGSSLAGLMTMDGSTTYSWANDFILGMAGNNQCSGFYGPMSVGGSLSYFTQISQYFDLMRDTFTPVNEFWYNDATGQLKIIGNFKKGDMIVLESFVFSYSDVDNSIASQAGYGTAGLGFTNNQLHHQYANPDNRISAFFAGQENVAKQGSYNNRWVKDYSTALVKEIQGTVLSKHQGLQLPGGVTVDGLRLIEEAKEEKRVLREELLLLDPGVPILRG